jgi:hypothetical protein
MMLLTIVGAAPSISTPPPTSVALVAGPPFRTEKPDRTLLRSSEVLKMTVEVCAPPSMIVLAEPSELMTVMALPLKSMFS